MSIIQQVEKKERLYALDLYRIISVFFVFLFHSNMHLGVSYGFLTPFISQCAIFMIVFFILSGFSLYYRYYDKDLSLIKDIKYFYIKRVIRLYPLYIAVYILYVIVFNNLSVIKNLIIAPIELLLLQSFFDGSFSILHNGGTWFVSCIFFCYLLFPFLKNILSQITKYRKVLLCIIYSICAISPIIVLVFNLSNIYSNPFFRLLEFIIGMITASIFLDGNKKENKYFFFAVLFEWAVLVLVVSLLVNHIATNNYVVYNFISIPVFVLLLYHLSNINNNFLTTILNNTLIQYLSNISYTFFLVQFFTWAPTRYIQKQFKWCDTNTNIKLFICSFIICLICSVFLYEFIDKPIRKFLNKRLLDK